MARRINRKDYKYTYKVCSKCKLDKEENRSSYCPQCIRDYGKLRRFLNNAKPNIGIKSLENFIVKVERDNLHIGLADIKAILFFYEILTKDMGEYDDYTSGKQIILMWCDLLVYYVKNKKEHS